MTSGCSQGLRHKVLSYKVRWPRHFQLLLTPPGGFGRLCNHPSSCCGDATATEHSTAGTPSFPRAACLSMMKKGKSNCFLTTCRLVPLPQLLQFVLHTYATIIDALFSSSSMQT